MAWIFGLLASFSLVGCAPRERESVSAEEKQAVVQTQPEAQPQTVSTVANADEPAASSANPEHRAPVETAAANPETANEPADAIDPDARPYGALDNFGVIQEGRAYRSAQLSPERLRAVCEKYGIRRVINLRGPNPSAPWYQREKAVCQEMGVELVDIAWSSKHLPPPDRLLAFYDEIVAARGPILIHCSAGADRTGAASAIWRIVVAGDTKESAAGELSMRYGHFRFATPKMGELVEMFQPRREWIESEYKPE